MSTRNTVTKVGKVGMLAQRFDGPTSGRSDSQERPEAEPTPGLVGTWQCYAQLVGSGVGVVVDPRVDLAACDIVGKVAR